MLNNIEVNKMNELIKVAHDEKVVFEIGRNKIGGFFKVEVNGSEHYKVYVKNGVYVLRYFFIQDGEEKRGRSFETADAQKAINYIKEII